MTDYPWKRDRFSEIPSTRIIVGSFLALIGIGTILLLLPAASNDAESAGLLTAVFTATSATCVTGLIVVDTVTQWTLFGQIVILALIQVGGLGLVTLATFFSLMLGKQFGLKDQRLAQESISSYRFEDVAGLVRSVILITISIELLGALILAIRFVPLFGAKGYYLSVFHSISAFCNAGFDLFGDYTSLSEFSGDPAVLYTTMVLVVTGGLGFIVWRDLYAFWRTGRLYLHTKMVLLVTGFLLCTGFVFFLAAEYGNPETLGAMLPWERIHAAAFQSVTPRTAGFSTFAMDGMTDISKMLTITLMFIGGAPGSTAGGIKITTIGVLVMAIVSNIAGKDETVILDRRVSHEVVYKALSAVGLSLVLLLVATTILSGKEDISFINALFEATSAFGTVGLSTGNTSALSITSKIVLIAMMFLGRVGPLTFAVAIAVRSRGRTQKTVYPEGRIMVG